MKTYRRRRKPLVMQLAQVGLAWALLGMAAGVVALSRPGIGALATDQAAGPTAEAIERAVVEAEAQAKVMQTRTTSWGGDAPSGKPFVRTAG